MTIICAPPFRFLLRMLSSFSAFLKPDSAVLTKAAAPAGSSTLATFMRYLVSQVSYRTSPYGNFDDVLLSQGMQPKRLVSRGSQRISVAWG